MSFIARRDTLARNAQAIKASVEGINFGIPHRTEPDPMTDGLPALFAYDRWANARIFDACRLVPLERYGEEVVPGWSSLRSTVVHIVAATDLWARRFLDQPADAFIPESELATIDEVARLSIANHDTFDRLILELTPEHLAAPFTYRNLQGQTVTAPLWAVLRHVVNHATYHRGQVASKLARLGVEAPVTDLVYWAINQPPQPG
jgi:uncharacterized damage-inducible protein DinB